MLDGSRGGAITASGMDVYFLFSSIEVADSRANPGGSLGDGEVEVVIVTTCGVGGVVHAAAVVGPPAFIGL